MVYHGFHEILHGIPVSFEVIQEMFIFLIPSNTFTKKPHICKKEKKSFNKTVNNIILLCSIIFGYLLVNYQREDLFP